jgi:hypothetical protein
MENVQQITISATAQLRSIYNEASSRLNQLLLGQDMFGYDPDWVPRLSYNFYYQELTNHIAQLKDLEATETAYEQAFADQNKSYTVIQRGLSAATQGREQANARISILTGPNGPLLTNAFQISLFDPIMVEKRAAIKADIANVAADIQKSINLDPQMILDGLSTLALAPSSFTVVVSHQFPCARPLSSVTGRFLVFCC